MKILYALVGLALLVYPTTTKAETPIPEDFLMMGVSKLTVCIRAENIALAKLNAIARQMKADEPGSFMAEDHKKTYLQVISAIENLGDITSMQKEMGKYLIMVLIQNHNYTLEDINKSMASIVSRTDTGMNELLKDVTEFDELNRLFVPKMEACTSNIEEMANQMKKYSQKS